MWSRASRPAFRLARGVASAPLVVRTSAQPLAASSKANGAANRAGVVAATALAAVAAATYAVKKNTQCEEQSGVDWAAVRAEIVKILDADGYTDSSYEGANPGPFFIRLAWHSSGTYCKKTQTGGSDGATMRFGPEIEWGANAGLDKAQQMLEPVKQRFPSLSYSDLWIYAACVAIEEMGGHKVPFTPGRRDKGVPGEGMCPSWEGDTHKDGRLPSANMGSPSKTATHLRYIFNRGGFDDKEIVALSGAHGLGACHTDRSGFWGPWTRAPTTVSNEYYRELLENKWTIKTTHKGEPWTGPMQFEDPTGDLMMLPSDLVLIIDKDFKKHVEHYASNEAAFQEDFAKVVGKLFSNGC